MSKNSKNTPAAVDASATVPTGPGNALATQPPIMRDKFFLAQRAAMPKAQRSLLDDWLAYSQDGSIIVSKLAFGRHREANRPLPTDGKPRRQLSDNSVKNSVASAWSSLINQTLQPMQSKLPSATTAEIIARHNRKSDFVIFVDGRAESDDDGTAIVDEANAMGISAEEFADLMKVLK